MQRIITGGQTGVDTGAMDAALESGIETGGWCPPGCLNESGKIPDHYMLKETEAENSSLAPNLARSLRTERNVQEADAVLIMLPEVIQADEGTIWTLQYAIIKGKPLLQVDPTEHKSVAQVIEWLVRFNPKALNIAGPPESVAEGIGQLAYAFMMEVFSGLPTDKLPDQRLSD
jgi:hypothetical protein